MSSNNRKTIDTYEASVKKYEDTKFRDAAHFRAWKDTTLAQLKPEAAVLELGSGLGQDADYIEYHGFTVDRTDVTEGFVRYQQQHGKQARVLNAITDDYGGTYDLIFAAAVFLHFDPDELAQALTRVKAALKPGGIVSFTLKQGEGSGWTEARLEKPRYFKYWQPSEIRRFLHNHGFEIVYFDDETQADIPEQWLQIIAQPDTELIDELDEQGSTTGKQVTKYHAHDDGLWHRSAWATIVDQSGRILLQHRSENMVLSPGKWAFAAAGHVDAGESHEQGILREMSEEIGIVASEGDLTLIHEASLEHDIPGWEHPHREHIKLYALRAEPEQVGELQSEEVDEVRWFEPRELRELLEQSPELFTNHIDIYVKMVDFVEAW